MEFNFIREDCFLLIFLSHLALFQKITFWSLTFACTQSVQFVCNDETLYSQSWQSLIKNVHIQVNYLRIGHLTQLSLRPKCVYCLSSMFLKSMLQFKWWFVIVSLCFKFCTTLTQLYLKEFCFVVTAAWLADNALMQLPTGFLNSPSSLSLHLCSPFHQNCCVKIHHHFTSFSKQLGKDSPLGKRSWVNIHQHDSFFFFFVKIH